MSHRPLLFVALATLAAACGGSTSGGDSSQGSSSGAQTNGGSSGGATPSGPEYLVGCNGDVSAKSLNVDLEIEPRCVGGAPGTRCGESDGGVCNPQNVTFYYEPPAHKCIASDVYAWDGTACVAHKTGAEGGSLHCKGSDCPNIYTTKEVCESVHASCAKK